MDFHCYLADWTCSNKRRCFCSAFSTLTFRTEHGLLYDCLLNHVLLLFPWIFRYLRRIKPIELGLNAINACKWWRCTLLAPAKREEHRRGQRLLWGSWWTTSGGPFDGSVNSPGRSLHRSICLHLREKGTCAPRNTHERSGRPFSTGR